MNIDNLEIWVHDHVLKNDTIRHFVYGAYQRGLYLISPKFKSEGQIERITPDDENEYFFGYYDKCPWSDDEKYILALRVKNSLKEADSTEEAEIIRIEWKNKKIETLATTHTWNVQQGCMMQWLSNDEIIYNDFRDGKYCSVVLNLNTKLERIIGMPVYTISDDRKIALSLDFSRLHRLRPGYGYGNIPEVTKNEKCPDSTCIWKIDIITGEIVPLLKYTDFKSFEKKDTMVGAEHKVNHIMISPNGQRFMVLHRWFLNGVKYTRLVTCNLDGTDMYNLADDNFVSHCCWKNNEEILSYLKKEDGGKGYYLMRDRTHEYEKKWPELIMDGHPTYSQDESLVVTDTYPNRTRIQSIYIMQGNNVHRIARVFSPFKYKGDVRCDLHPRWSKDKSQICFDASLDGKRGIYSVEVPSVLNNSNVVVEKKTKVTVLMATYNGEKYLREQIESIKRQINVDVNILVRDDGSTDNTKNILNEYQDKGVLRWYTGEHLNVQKSFLNLLMESPESDYYAFCDQDDVWDDNKLYCAVEHLKNYVDDKPALYYSGLRIVDSNLNVIRTHYITDNRLPEANYFISNVAGCTEVFNKKLKDLVNLATPDFVLMHDSWIYKICLSVGGYIYADKYAHINYRQHNLNVVGIKGGIKSKVRDIFRYINKFEIQKQMQNLLYYYGDKMEEEYYAYTKLICEYNKSLVKWFKLLTFNKLDFKSKGLNILVRIKIFLRKV